MNKSIYLVLSLINILLFNYLNAWKQLFWIQIFAVLVIMAQVMLVVGVKNLLSDQKTLFKSSLLVLKFFILILGFYIAKHNIENYLLICIGFYIFQLLILVLSIKNNGSFK